MNTPILPQTRPIDTQCTAYRFGVEDAQVGDDCTPEMYFVHPDDVTDYALGYASVRGHTLTTMQLLADLVIPVMPTTSAA